ncbi:hypothetical protein Mp_4g04720 [Marchantia polymorpha subsp. ruderalis]|uniref:Uncharacterized protein n=2 Tax=Marchantia polymorpha TaxID=3197 RepID=A0AAF6B6E5_MARPO|nr:hypothetical protein MARPO_0044s0003 [Marchantia polymorpha]BBN07579.1 hypothetical protein Mp_4g04720 [Marchantia polymorpha subsp. ruderalis]|eukprot:PTQ39521.1 hypothetical protein MARPO_0044s0003 [Marchantia polymorpha]
MDRNRVSPSLLETFYSRAKLKQSWQDSRPITGVWPSLLKTRLIRPMSHPAESSLADSATRVTVLLREGVLW